MRSGCVGEDGDDDDELSTIFFVLEGGGDVYLWFFRSTSFSLVREKMIR